MFAPPRVGTRGGQCTCDLCQVFIASKNSVLLFDSLSLLIRNSSPSTVPNRGQYAAQYPHLGQHPAIHQQLLLARPGFRNVDRREGALICDLAVEHDFRVAGTFELLEDHLIHPRSGIDQRGRNDRQRTALLDVACGTEEALRPLQRVRVDAAGQHLAG